MLSVKCICGGTLDMLHTKSRVYLYCDKCDNSTGTKKRDSADDEMIILWGIAVSKGKAKVVSA